MIDFKSSAGDRETVANRTLSEAIADRMRTAIVFGELRPGERLWQDRLAERFGVSRIPVREALRQLSAEGLVVLHSHRSATVTKLSAEEVEELFAMIGALETLASVRGAERIGEEDLEELRAILEELRLSRNDRRRWELLNYRFHLAVMRPSGWNRLGRSVEEMRRNLSRYVSFDLHEACVETWDAQHQRIYEACARGDPQGVRFELEEHWRYTLERVMPLVRAPAAPVDEVAD